MAAVTNLLFLNSDAISQGIVTGDTVTAPGDWTFTQNVDVLGNLTVTGTITSGATINSVSIDRYLDLGFGYLIGANNSGGFTLDVRLAAGFVPGNITNFPTLTSFIYTNAGSSTPLAPGDVVMISNLPPATQVNEGYYIVQSVSSPTFPQTVTIYSSTQSGTPWANTSFVATGLVAPSGFGSKIDLTIIAVADGTSNFKDDDGLNWPVGTVLSAYVPNAALAAFQVNGAYNAIGDTSLQRAYDLGSTISTDNGVPIAFTVSDGNFTIDGTGLIDLSVDTSVAVQAPTINIGTDTAGTTANNVIHVGSSTTTAMTLELADNQASVFTLTQGPNQYIDVTTTNGAETLDLGAPGVNAVVNINSGTGSINIAAGGVAGTVNAGTGSATQSLNFGTGLGVKTVTIGSTNLSSSLTLQSGTGNTSINSTGNTILNSTGFIYIDQHTMFRDRFAGTNILASENLVVGEVLTIEGSTNPALATEPRVKKANAGATDLSERRFFGIVASASITSGNSGFAATVPGLIVPVLFVPAEAPVSAAQNGDPVFISFTSGRATMIAPILSNQTVVQIGHLVSAAAVAANTYTVTLAPQFIGLIP